ncbi:hypothetical protein NPIL_134991 [Nephila pilipes]|uniref:non-specific serine/threonine protein kinase n=1 Tax=Nephila pilipes TaxID=299642 RepID=A0A8X6P534_NEPPI|nr:hypothetical protein NPIL_134991 [Nephila pilipes]
MTSCQTLFLFCSIFSLHLAYAVPLSEGLDEIPSQVGSLPGYAIFLISAAAILLLGYVVIGCVCCPNHNIKALSYQNGFTVSRLNENSSLQFENPSEFAIFPPHSTVIDLQPVGLGYPSFEDKVTFEPLPDILPRKLSGQSAACSSRPAHFRALLKNKVSLHDWFDDPNSNFPRDQLQYIRELGCGWFGRVVEGEASHITNTEEKTHVLVKILREEASPSEHLHFLHEVRPYRDLSHPNVIQLLGRCLESDPFLLIMEHSTSDLKTFLIQHENKDGFIKNGLPLQMACNIAAGLKCLHENGFTHMDLAAHNCFVCKDSIVKVGDYGISFDQCREDYYCLGGIALPIRWCSPETLQCTEATIETKEITKEANVWAFGIILWEIFELGKLPYEELTNEEVLQKVLIEKSTQLLPPSHEFPVKEELSLIMKECWKPAHLRPSMDKVEKFLTRLYNDRHNLKTLEISFEERWNSLQPKPIETKLLGTDFVPMKFENDFSERSDSHNYSSDGERFSSFEMSYDMYSKSIGSHLSPSLRVLNGSIDELTENDVCLNSVSLGGEKSAADAASVTSDSDLPQLEDDQGSRAKDVVTPEQISDAVKNLDLVLTNQPFEASRQSTVQKIHLHGKKSMNPFISESFDQAVSNVEDARVPSVSQYNVENIPNLNLQNSLQEQQLNNLKTLDDNYNELPHNSCEIVTVHRSTVNESEDAEMMSVDNSPDSLNANKVLDLSVQKVELVERSKEETVLFEKETTICIDKIDLGDQKKNGLCAVPDIIVHESPSLIESVHDENENMVQETCSEVVVYPEPTKPFRFVFKEDSVPLPNGESHKENSEERSESQNTPSSTESSLGNFPEDLKSIPRSRQLTSTPLKSDQDINLNYSSKCADNEDSGSVFYNSHSESSQNFDNSSPVMEEYYSATCEASEKTPAATLKNLENFGIISDGNFHYEAPTKADATFKIKSNNITTKESITSVNHDEFASAHSTFGWENSENVSKKQTLTGSPNMLNDNYVSGSINKTVVVNIPLPSFNSEINACDSSLTESNGLDKDSVSSKSEESKSFHNSESSFEKNNTQKLEYINPDNIASFDFGEPVTPEVSFNVSSCSYGNDCRSYSTDSPGISSENKDLEYDFESSFPCKKQGSDVDYNVNSTTIDYLLKDTENHKHTDILDSGTTQNCPTLDSEASGSEYLESFSPDVTPDSFGSKDEKRMESIDNMRPPKSNFLSTSCKANRNSFYDEEDLENDSESDTNAYKSKSELRLHPYDEVIVEDLETGEQTIITESFSACDDYDNSADSDEILKINIETDEAIIVDSSEALIGFVPSRSIELLQECEIIPTLNPSFTVEDEKESSDSNNFDASNSASSSPVAMQATNSPCESPDTTYPLHQPYRNFSLQNEVIEEEITDEIATPSSIHSTASFSSNDGFLGEEKMSQSSESYNQEVCETSVLPSVDHFYGESDDGSKSDVSDSDCSPIHDEKRIVNNLHYRNGIENNHLQKELQDVMYSKQPTQSVCWHSDETLDIERDSPVILEGQEILAGGVLETRGMSFKDITATLNQLDVEDRLNRKVLDHLNVSQSPSPYSSLESSPCRDAYTPDFESDSEEGGTSCSSTSGSFECIHNKFKDTVDISKAADESEVSDSSREQSPRKVFSKTWDCHATPSKSVLVTPEKKFNSLRKSVSFHEEDPHVVFEYPPASDSSEDGGINEDNRSWGIDYRNFEDWEFHAGEHEEAEIEEVLEIEELDSEPYVRRPTYGIGASLGPLNRPMYTLTSGFSDDDMDLSEPFTIPSESIAPSNSPEEGKQPSISGDQISELIKSQLNNLALEESRLKWMQDELDQQSHKFSFNKPTLDKFSTTSVHTSEDTIVNNSYVTEQDIVIEELLPESSENVTVRQEDLNSKLISQENLSEDPFVKNQDENSISLNTKEEAVPVSTEKKKLLENECDGFETKPNLNEVLCIEEIKINQNVENFDLLINIDAGIVSDSELDGIKEKLNSLDMNVSLMGNKESLNLNTDKSTVSSSNLIDIESVKNNHSVSFETQHQEENIFQDLQNSDQSIFESSALSQLKEMKVEVVKHGNNLDEQLEDFISNKDVKEKEPVVDTLTSPSSGFSDQSDDFVSSENISLTNEKENIGFTPSTEVTPLTLEEGNKRPKPIKNKSTSNESNDSFSLLSDVTSTEQSFDEKLKTETICLNLSENANCTESMKDSNEGILTNCFEINSKKNAHLEFDLIDITAINKLDNSSKNFDPDTEAQNQIESSSLPTETKDNTEIEPFSILDSAFSSQLNNIQNEQNSCILMTKGIEKDFSELEKVFNSKIDNLPSNQGSIDLSMVHNVGEIFSNNFPSSMETVNKSNNESLTLLGDVKYNFDPSNENKKIIQTDVTNLNEDFLINEKDNVSSKMYEEIIKSSCTNQIEELKGVQSSSVLLKEYKDAENEHSKLLLSDQLNKNSDNREDSSDFISNEEGSSKSEKGSALHCHDLTKTLNSAGKKAEIKKDLLEPLPKIVVTPASESEVEDELEEYLRDQLEFFHGPSVSEGEDFSVTSQYSVRPFEDVFGSHGAPQNSGDYIEAFNFEFDSGDFFEDFIDDYPAEVSNTNGLSLDDGNIRWWESDAPPMIEKSSENDDLNSKPESSPLYYSSKDSTHL